MSNDYLMRQIEQMSRAIALFIFNRKEDEIAGIINEQGGLEKEALLRYILKKYTLEGRVNEAEDLLFETLRPDPDPLYLPVALEFYETLRAMEPARLASCNFTPAEIREGLRDIMELFAISRATADAPES